jgi:hypothetical protein
MIEAKPGLSSDATLRVLERVRQVLYVVFFAATSSIYVVRKVDSDPVGCVFNQGRERESVCV